ncbi:peptidoglycan DD-metalloendopeptidase family protein [Streptomyces sp. NPDC089424]|uniref:M23 family metallopeptidase n=1 Tax=Streptomyces sp. NPDC089424 TaxID=3365917 RepID=UPI0037F840E2
MPAKGKHRRPKSQRFTRSIAVAGTGGAALALPLMGAAGAHAAPVPSAAEKAVSSIPVQKTAVRQQVTEKQSAAKQATAQKSAARTYSVRVGDYLSKIADEQDVSGGWQRLYEDNREAVGENPSLIHPGLKLTIGERAESGADEPASSSSGSSEAESSASTASPSSESSESSEPAAEAQAPEPAAAEAPAADTAAAAGYSAPVDGAGVGTAYRVAGSMWASGYHTGVDFAAASGTPLKSVGAGTVVSAGWAGSYGNQVVIKLADGFYAQYAHLSSLSVSSGQSVTGGQQIGLSGSTGNSTGPHLHFEIRTTPDYGSDVDPVAYLASKGVTVG